MKKNVLGIKIDDVTMDQALKVVESWLSKDGKSFGKAQDKHYIVTPNPEMVVAAQGDKVFKKMLNDADLSIPDGVGLKLSGKVKNVVYGTDFMEKLVGFAAKKGFTVGLLGGKGDVAKKCAEHLFRKYPGLKVIFAESGGEVDMDGQPLKLLKILKADILFIAFGHIKQEKWMAKNLHKIPVRVAMAVGGAFDYFSGTIPRAPKRIRDLGFEWLFRLVIQPWRIKRQLSLLKYLYLLIRD